MSKKIRTELNALLRLDFPSFFQRSFQTVVPGQVFLPNWHMEAMCHALMLCLQGEIQRLIITLPPRSGKSICASVAFPAFALGQDPQLRIVCASYSQELAAKHARDFRAVLESSWYRSLFPKTRINSRKNTEGEIETTARGYRMSTSVGGTLTGRGGNIIVIDDSMKPADATSDVKRTAVNEWFDGTLLSRLDRKTQDVIVIVQQRLHVDDLVGHVLEKGGDWTVLNLPAIAEEDQRIAIGDRRFYFRAAGEVLHPEREPLSVLEQLKRRPREPSFLRPVPAGADPCGGSAHQAQLAALLRSPTRASPERPDHSELGHSDQLGSGERLLSLHDLADPGNEVLPAGCVPRASRESGSPAQDRVSRAGVRFEGRLDRGCGYRQAVDPELETSGKGSGDRRPARRRQGDAPRGSECGDRSRSCAASPTGALAR